MTVLQRGTSMMKKLMGKEPQTPGTPQHHVSIVEKKMIVGTPPTIETIQSSSKFKRLVQRLRRKDRIAREGTASFVFHGEDAMATGSFYQIVADGVSNAHVDVPPGSLTPSAILARTLVHLVEETILNNPLPSTLSEFEMSILGAIRIAQVQCQQVGSVMGSTLVVAYIHVAKKCLYTFCVGDSKCLVVRKDRIVYETLSVVKEFNVPSTINHHTLRPQMYVSQSTPLQRGDLVMSFSDGFGDNIYKDELLRVLASAKSSNEPFSALCTRLVHHCKSHITSIDVEKTSFPFSAAAAMEYISRVKQCPQCSDMEIQRMEELVNRFQSRRRHLLARQLSVGESTKHYSLNQLYNMANLSKKKPDDISLALLEYR